MAQDEGYEHCCVLRCHAVSSADEVSSTEASGDLILNLVCSAGRQRSGVLSGRRQLSGRRKMRSASCR